MHLRETLLPVPGKRPEAFLLYLAEVGVPVRVIDVATEHMPNIEHYDQEKKAQQYMYWCNTAKKLIDRNLVRYLARQADLPRRRRDLVLTKRGQYWVEVRTEAIKLNITPIEAALRRLILEFNSDWVTWAQLGTRATFLTPRWREYMKHFDHQGWVTTKPTGLHLNAGIYPTSHKD